MLPGEILLDFVSFLLNILQTFSKLVNKYYLLFEKLLGFRLTSSTCGSQAVTANSCSSLGELYVLGTQAIVMGLKLSDSLEILKQHFFLLELTHMRIPLASFATSEQCHSKSQVR